MVPKMPPVVSSPSVRTVALVQAWRVGWWISSGVVAPLIIAVAVWLWLVQNPKCLKLSWLHKCSNNIQEPSLVETLLITSESRVGHLPVSSNSPLAKSILPPLQHCVVELDYFLLLQPSFSSWLWACSPPSFWLTLHSKSYSLISLANNLNP